MTPKRSKYTDLPLPPEGPQWDSGREPGNGTAITASSAACSEPSEPGDPQSECPVSTSSSDGQIPGVAPYVDAMATAKAAQAPMFRQPTNETPTPPMFRTPARTGVREAKPVVEMGPEAREIKARIQEMFHAYSNRRDRSQQPTMGPSEIGYPCDRRIAMSLLRLTPVNPGTDGWAAFVGTCTHVGLADMLMWADAGSGRYAPEVKLTFPSRYVPFGTTDLIDRMLLVAMDWKVLGNWSLEKLRTEGPPDHYRIQAHTYAYGAKLKGEDIQGIAVIGMPREASSLDDMYVFWEPYRPELARKALARVDAIGDRLFDTPLGIAPDYTEFEINNSDCKFCPFYMKGAAKSEGGICNGRS